MKRLIFLALGAAVVAAVASGITWAITRSRVYFAAERVTTSRLSPDELFRASLVELHSNNQLDRNVSIRLEDIKNLGISPPIILLPTSPNEGFPAGTERFIWSRDGSRFLLVGRHFFVRADLTLTTGEQVYFLHDRAANRSYLNSAKTEALPGLTADLILASEYTEPVTLKKPDKVDPDSAPKGE